MVYIAHYTVHVVIYCTTVLYYVMHRLILWIIKNTFLEKIKIKTKSYAYISFSCPSSSRYEMVFYIYTVKPDDHLSCIGGRWCIENKHRLRFLSRWPPVYVYYTQCVHLEHIACQGRCEMGEVEIRLSLFTHFYGWLLFF